MGEVDGERMTHDQMLDIGFLFILGGLDTVTSTLDCAVGHLGRDAALRDPLVADPTLIPAAIEELLRLHTPVMQVLRVIKEPYEMHGVKMEPGDHVMLMLGRGGHRPATSSVTRPTRPTSTVSTTATWPSAAARIAASAPIWPAPSCASRSRRCTAASPTTASPTGPS